MNDDELSPSQQHGIALVIGMIMLVLLTLLVVSAVNTGSVNLRITSNMQVAGRGARRCVSRQ